MDDDETTTTKKSRLNELELEFQATGGKLPSKAEQKTLVKTLVNALKAREAAESAVSAASEQVEAASLACVKAFGKRSIEIEGSIYDPSCRGETVYYRPRRTAELDLIRI